MLIALGGLPGVGKSALARSLARRIGAVHLRIDTIEQAMRNAGFTVSGPEGYLAARDLAEDNLRVGRTVIVDSVNPLAITRAYWCGAAARMAVELLEIEVVCSDRAQHRRRVESRDAEIPGLVLPTWQQVLDRRYEPWTTAHVIDTAGRTAEESASEAEAIALGAARPGRP
ncbi:MAG: AAA family ATPase [Acidobacteria bacterium]|nr:AAA family ATPase [Acidobacteriota bacterium]